MKITKWDAQAAEDIGHAFGHYDYGQETGMGVFYSSKEAVANYIAGYVRMAFEGQMLYTTSERGEGYIAYTLPGQKMNFKAGMAILKALFHNMSLKEMICMGKALSKGGKSLQDRMKKEKKKFIFVGMVCVREQYQGQGYMRKVLDMAFSEGNRLHVPVILETDAKSKCDKYMHLGMELEGVRDMGVYGKMYDLIKYPD
ncbi:N-acetyltransferase [Coprococcus sp. AF16-22]|uniref:N-acetyltransferase n=1 Tax=Coprococcus sp. AF16-22 TaxID=2293087 RepID=UPI000E55607B|nr:N-acetyltransferase [Coprococcus sp. AF16-22]RGG98664.1 N-acetyltransferase [Coprococcus sp. AF16-22]